MLKNAKVHAEATKALCSSEGVTENTDGTYVYVLPLWDICFGVPSPVSIWVCLSVDVGH